jgi:hypothetical protein
MRRTVRLAFVVVLAGIALAAPGELWGAISGDRGWSDDGTRYGFCSAAIPPDAPDGCLFFDRRTLEWVEVGRREALQLWQVWRPPMVSVADEPLLPVFPLDDSDFEEGAVSLNGRITETDDVVEIWRLKKPEAPDEAGSEWETVFDYSPDGTWLAAGAVRVGFSEPENQPHIIVRPVSHWLVLAGVRAGLKHLAAGELADGLGALADAGWRLDELARKEGEGKSQGKGKPPVKKRKLEHFIGDEKGGEPSWIESRAVVRWSGDGKKLCVCDAWEDAASGKRAACRYFDLGKGVWTAIVAEKIWHVCLPPKPPPLSQVDEGRGEGEASWWVDWGRPKGATDLIEVVVYRIDAKKQKLAAVLRRDVKEALKPSMDEGSIEPVFHAVGIPSPAGKNIVVGFARESSDHSSLMYELEVDTAEGWAAKAAADLARYKRSPSKVIEKVQGIFSCKEP